MCVDAIRFHKHFLKFLKSATRNKQICPEDSKKNLAKLIGNIHLVVITNQSIYLFQTTRIHSKQRTDDRKVTEYTNETDRNTVTLSKYQFCKLLTIFVCSTCYVGLTDFRKCLDKCFIFCGFFISTVLRKDSQSGRPV